MRLHLNVRRADTSYEVFKARLFSNDPVALGMKASAEKFGGRINLAPDTNIGLNALSTVEKIWKEDNGVQLERVLSAIKAAWGDIDGAHGRATFLQGINWFLARHESEADHSRFLEKIRMEGPASRPQGKEPPGNPRRRPVAQRLPGDRRGLQHRAQREVEAGDPDDEVVEERPQERRQQVGLTEAQQAEVKAIARGEIASLAGLVLRRLQEEHFTRSIERNAMEDVLDERLSEIFGEALRDFGDTKTEPGTANRSFDGAPRGSVVASRHFPYVTIGCIMFTSWPHHHRRK
jgi:hypothetical protein